MQKFYSEREVFGPEFDDRLIQLVRKNPAIYDVSHPNYRRNPVRVAIWERLANELGASSRFLQTKWKNIRYNYLQEIKCMETGTINTNIRKRRFTEDLSFLQHTAQTYNVKKPCGKNYNSSDNDSNSYMYADVKTPNCYEVIEIEHSDDGGVGAEADEGEVDAGSQQTFEVTQLQEQYDDTPMHCDVDEGNDSTSAVTLPLKLETNTESAVITADESDYAGQSPRTKAHVSRPSSPLLTPLLIMGNGQPAEMNGEITIEPIPKHRQRTHQRRHSAAPPVPPSEIMANAAKRKAMPAPFPVLTPINDPIELYCLSLVDSLRSMPRFERERVKYEFAKILKDAKYKDQS